jgi:hypothetical protein
MGSKPAGLLNGDTAPDRPSKSVTRFVGREHALTKGVGKGRGREGGARLWQRSLYDNDIEASYKSFKWLKYSSNLHFHYLWLDLNPTLT